MHTHSPEFLLQLLQRCSYHHHATQLKQIHSLLLTNGHLIITYKWTNTLLYNTLIRSYLNISETHTCLLLFKQMLHHQAQPNNHTFPSVLKATDSQSLARSYHAQCTRRGLLKDPFVQTSFLSGYSQFDDSNSVRNVFDEMPQPCMVSCNAMLAAYGKSGDMGMAVSMFLNMNERDVYSWTSMISGYTRNGCFKEAIDFFGKMMADDCTILRVVRPNESTFVSVLSACANLDNACALYQGKQIHGFVVKNEELTVFLGTALIAFYGKIGCLDYAANVFDEMPVRKVCTWNAMICSLASNSKEREALQVFETMKDRAIHPNEVTFVGVLSACARTKLVDFGLELFRSMSLDFGIVPLMEHYGCVVDLLGRGGLLKEACEFIRSMPFEPDASVLGALLGACRVHGAVELGKEVGKRLLELQPRHCGRYVLLSSVYAEAGIWDRAAGLRKEMVDAGIKKVPAFSKTD